MNEQLEKKGRLGLGERLINNLIWGFNDFNPNFRDPEYKEEIMEIKRENERIINNRKNHG